MQQEKFAVIVWAAIGFAGSPALAQTPPDYGFNWVTIGAPGNRAATASEAPAWTGAPLGSVDHEYRMTQSKLDVEHYLEFVRAYAPFWQGHPYDLALTGPFIATREPTPGVYTHDIRPGCEGAAARIEWQMAARYCNWLQNGKANTAAAFESGVYDTSTFHLQNPGWSAQLTPSPGAKYWIPNLDEWVKAAYYDPNKDGGQGGYWSQPNASDQPLTMGLPGQGGQTIGDLLWQTDPNRQLGAWALGQYPQVQSPWGLIDISGTVPDYTSAISNYNTHTLWMGGSLAGDSAYFFYDQFSGFFGLGNVWGSTVGGLRIASAVPEPCTSLIIAVFFGLAGRRRKRCASTSGPSRSSFS